MHMKRFVRWKVDIWWLFRMFVAFNHDANVNSKPFFCLLKSTTWVSIEYWCNWNAICNSFGIRRFSINEIVYLCWLNVCVVIFKFLLFYVVFSLLISTYQTVHHKVWKMFRNIQFYLLNYLVLVGPLTN